MSVVINGITGITAPGTEIFGDGTALGGATNPIVSMAKGANNYVQSYIVNNTNGTSSSADMVAYPSNGTDAHGWVDMGITSLTYADTTYTVTGPNESYLFGSAPSGSGATGNLVIATDNTGTANAIQFYTNGFTQAKSAAKMTIDSSGNVGIGVAPTNQTNYKNLQVVNTQLSAASNGLNDTILSSNLSWNGTNWSYLYGAGTYGTYYRQVNGTHLWASAPSGTTTVTPTVSMFLGGSAFPYLGIGTITPAYPLHVTNGGASGALSLSPATTNGGASYILMGNSDSGGASGPSMIVAANRNLQFGVGSSFTAAGGGTFTEAMRLDTNGNWMLGTTTPQALATIWRTVNGGNLQITNTSSTYTSPLIQATGYATGSNTWYAFVAQSGNGSTVTTNTCFIYGNGNVVNANNSYGAISDIKLKENIVDTTPKLNDLLKVKVRNYNLIGDYEQHKQLGVVAQELEEVFPSLVEETADKDIDGNDLGTTTKQVKYSIFVPMLIKAIQEQQALITDLTTRLAVLEAK